MNILTKPKLVFILAWLILSLGIAVHIIYMIGSNISLFGFFDPYFLLTASEKDLSEYYPRVSKLIPIVSDLAMQLLVPIGFLGFAYFIYLEGKLSIAFNNLLILTMSLFGAVLVGELLLRLIGYYPNFENRTLHFRVVNELREKPGYTTDEYGVFHVDTNSFYQLHRKLNSANNDGLLQERFALLSAMYSYPNKLITLCTESSHLNTHFGACMTNDDAKKESNSHYPSFNSLVQSYVRNPVNSYGFYSIDFVPAQESKTSILLLGDSFTFGLSAKPIANSFSNILLSQGYQVFNSGIIGSDVAQYQQVLRQFGKLTNPDYVIVNFYMGNDMIGYERFPEPHLPMYYTTNAGNLNSFQKGEIFKSAESAYENIVNHMSISTCQEKHWLLRSSAFGTQLWLILERLQYFQRCKSVPVNQEEVFDIDIVNKQIRQIQTFCNDIGARMILVAIPEWTKNDLITPDQVSGLFEGIEYFCPNMSSDMYVQKESDRHFNNRGHYFYSKYLEGLVLYFEEMKEHNSNGKQP